MKKIIIRKYEFPVSQRQLARYLGVSASMMTMVGKNQRTLPKDSFYKLMELRNNFEQEQISKKSGKSCLALKKYEDQQCIKIAKKMRTEAKYFVAKTKVLETQLNNMLISYENDSKWLNVIDDKLAALRDGNKKSEADYFWLTDQQVRVSERLKKNDLAAQIKLELEIETSRALASINESLYNKLLSTPG